MKKVKWILIVIVLAVVSGTLIYLSTLRIHKITYEGNERIKDEELEGYIFRDKYDKNPFMFYYKTKYKEQPMIPFVDRYDVEIKSLSSVLITVYEKDMIACVKYMGAYLFFVFTCKSSI